ncbi:hypothetical protein PO909_016412, partial [Leuciscus waleckii]
MELKWKLLLGLFLPSCSGCLIGFKLVQMKCVDEDECATSPSVCGDHSECVNTHGSYSCACVQGFIMRVPTGQCTDINKCANKPFYGSGDV